MLEQYVAEIDGHGYYAKAQPTYAYCYTTMITKAAVFKTLNGAQRRADQCVSVEGRDMLEKPAHRVIKIDGNFVELTNPEWVQYVEPPERIIEVGPEITLASLRKVVV